jgi:hypothetical protein
VRSTSEGVGRPKKTRRPVCHRIFLMMSQALDTIEFVVVKPWCQHHCSATDEYLFLKSFFEARSSHI